MQFSDDPYRNYIEKNEKRFELSQSDIQKLEPVEKLLYELDFIFIRKPTNKK